MRIAIWILFFTFLSSSLYSQYYLRGGIKDEMGHTMESVRIQLASAGTYPYYSGNSGSFGIPSSKIIDTITLSFDGYEICRKPVDTRKFQSLVMRMLPATSRLYNRKLVSVTPHLRLHQPGLFSMPGESYSSIIENTFVKTDQYPETGFALNIDKASYSNIRRFLNNEMPVPTDAVRIEEMLNYFNFRLSPELPAIKTFATKTMLTTCPWNDDNRLLFLNINAPKLSIDHVAPSNLVFLIDISGSMDRPNRLPLLQTAFKLLVDNLRIQDTITVMTYGGGVGIALPPTSGIEKKKIRNAIDSLNAGGDTPGEGAIKMAYELARKNYILNGNNRVILATDGDFNVGQTSEKELEYLITSYRRSGIYLTCLGVGMGNYKDSKLETLSKKGNGNFAYIDNIQEAEKVLVTEFTKTLYAVANDAYLNVNFDANAINQYRLIGFDNKKNDMEDSTSELEGGDIGSGHTVIALFELKTNKNDSLFLHQPFAHITLQYKIPGSDQIIKQPFTALYEPKNIEAVDTAYRFAAAVAMFGSVLKQSPFIKGHSYEDVLLLAKNSANQFDMHQKEFITLVEKAMKIYHPAKKRKKQKIN